MSRAPGHVFIEEAMGTVISINVRGPAAMQAADSVSAALARIRRDELVFSTFQKDSDISILRAGQRTLHDLDPRVAELWEQCMRLRAQTLGRFDAWWRGWFDPTGLVKGWSVERAARAELEPLVHEQGIDAVGMNAGGDLQVFTAPDADWTWRIGVAHPVQPHTLLATVELVEGPSVGYWPSWLIHTLLATVELVEGAVATSGTAERGAHLFDPLRREPVACPVGATVVADSLAVADVWATVAAVAGVDDLSWMPAAPTRSGVVSDGVRTRRWACGVELGMIRCLDPPASWISATTPGSTDRRGS